MGHKLHLPLMLNPCSDGRDMCSYGAWCWTLVSIVLTDVEPLVLMFVSCVHMCSYGGLACRDLMAMARGLLEATDEAYQEYRHGW